MSEPTALESLIEMGFPANRAEKALAVTKHQGLQPAMDWLLTHQDDPDIDDPLPEGHKLSDSTQPAPTASTAAAEQPKSLKCDDCGKLFKSELDVQAHAARTQHQNFSESTDEIKPLTEEEKKERLQKLEEKMKQRRVEREEKEKKEALDREVNRRKSGKEIAEIKRKMELQEAKKLAEERKREKMEERLAKQRVRDQIARDRAERDSKAKAAQTAKQEAPPPTASAAPVKKEYDTCRVQIRLSSGGNIVETFKATDTFSCIYRVVQEKEGLVEGSYTLMTTFPRKVFSSDDSDKTFSELGLVPSAVIILRTS